MTRQRQDGEQPTSTVAACQLVMAVVLCYGGLTLAYQSGFDPQGSLRRNLFLPLFLLAFPTGRLLARLLHRWTGRAKRG